MVTRVPVYLGGTGESTQSAAQAALGLHSSNSVVFTTVTIGSTNVLANDYATYLNAQSNDGATLLSARANDLATWNSAQGNDHSTLLSARANDLATYNSALANDYSTYTAITNNPSLKFTSTKTFASDLVIEGNLFVLGDSITANVSNIVTEDKSIAINWNSSDALAEGAGIQIAGTSNAFIANLIFAAASTSKFRIGVGTLTSADDIARTQDYQANDLTTYRSALANDLSTWNSAQGNDHSTLLSARANDLATWNSAQGNDHSTLLSARANDLATWNSAQGNDHSTLLSARANDLATYNAALANDFSSYNYLNSNISFSANLATFNTNVSFAKANVLQQTLTDAATIAWDTSLGQIATVTLGASRTMGAPTNLRVGTYILHVIQGGAGSYTITWNGVFKWTAAVAPTLSTTVGRRDVFSFISDGTNLYGAMIPDVR
jgi:hypothetical protein